MTLLTTSNSQQPQKKQRFGEEQDWKESDRITQLPDPILVHIFSHLPTYDAVYRAGLVSKGWSSFWTSLPSLVFRQSDLNRSWNYTHHKFIFYVDHIFNYHNPYNFESCRFDFNYKGLFLNFQYIEQKLNSWIRLALHRKVKKLELLLGINSSYYLPRFLFRNEVLTSLTLQGVSFHQSIGEINWKLLTSLSIEQIRDQFTDDWMQKIFLGCPLLEYLKLSDCDGFKRLDIVSTTLRQLVLHNCKFGSSKCGDMLHVSAPFLQVLTITGFMYYQRCYLGESILKFENFYNNDYILRFKRLEKNNTSDDKEDEGDSNDDEEYGGECVKNVKKLTLGSWGLQVFVAEIEQFNCKSLTLNINIKQWELPGLASMLQNCPELESLTINMTSTLKLKVKCKGVDYDYDEKKNYWELYPNYRRCNCLLRHLKMVKIVGLVSNKGSKRVIEFLHFILKYAKVLEKLSIHVDSELNDENVFIQLSLFYMLTSFPKSSHGAVIQVISGDSILKTT